MFLNKPRRKTQNAKSARTKKRTKKKSPATTKPPTFIPDFVRVSCESIHKFTAWYLFLSAKNVSGSTTVSHLWAAAVGCCCIKNLAYPYVLKVNFPAVFLLPVEMPPRLLRPPLRLPLPFPLYSHFHFHFHSHAHAHSLEVGGHSLGRLQLPLNHGAPAPARLRPLPPQEVALLDLGVLPLVEQPAGRRDHVERDRVREQERQRPLQRSRSDLILILISIRFDSIIICSI